MKSDQLDPSSPVTEELEHELFISLQPQLQSTNTLTIHQLSQSISSSESSNPASTVEETRAHRVFQRKQPNTQILDHPQPTRLFSLHPQHTSTNEFLKFNLPSFP